MKVKPVILIAFSFAILTACAQNNEPAFKKPSTSWFSQKPMDTGTHQSLRD